MRTMKAAAAVLAVILLPMIASCAQGGKQSADGYVEPNDRQGVNIYADLSFFGAPGDQYVGKLEAGEIVELLGKTEKDANGKYEYTQIKLSNGKTGWASSYYVIGKTTPGVIVAEGGLLYTEAKATAASSTKVELYTIVAAVKDSNDPSFVQVSYTYSKSKRGQGFVKSNLISFLPADMKAVVLYNKAMNEKDPAVRIELLKSAAELESPAFKQVVATELSMMESQAQGLDPDEGETDVAVNESGTYMTTESDVPYYANPDTGSDLLGRFGDNEKFEVTRRLTESGTVDGVSNFWYYAEDKGWVFGAYIIQADN